MLSAGAVRPRKWPHRMNCSRLAPTVRPRCVLPSHICTRTGLMSAASAPRSSRDATRGMQNDVPGGVTRGMPRGSMARGRATGHNGQIGVGRSFSAKCARRSGSCTRSSSGRRTYPAGCWRCGGGFVVPLPAAIACVVCPTERCGRVHLCGRMCAVSRGPAQAADNARHTADNAYRTTQQMGPRRGGCRRRSTV